MRLTCGLGLFMMTSTNGNFSALAPICAENPSVIGWFSSQRPVTWSCEVFIDLHLNKRLSKRLRRRWFETPSCSLLRNCLVHSQTAWPRLKPKWVFIAKNFQHFQTHFHKNPFMSPMHFFFVGGITIIWRSTHINNFMPVDANWYLEISI